MADCITASNLSLIVQATNITDEIRYVLEDDQVKVPVELLDQINSYLNQIDGILGELLQSQASALVGPVVRPAPKPASLPQVISELKPTTVQIVPYQKTQTAQAWVDSLVVAEPKETSVAEQKTCSCCGTSKPIISFTLNSKRADGLDVYCRECKSSKYREWSHSSLGKETRRRLNTSQRYRAYDSRRNQTPARKAQMKAHRIVSKALKKELISKSTHCAFCSETYNLQAHHPNYSNQLDVVYLCPTHHRREHSKIKQEN